MGSLKVFHQPSPRAPSSSTLLDGVSLLGLLDFLVLSLVIIIALWREKRIDIAVVHIAKISVACYYKM